ncbi:hypothetical protein HMPREF0973_01185 [Prevotella veroralis F0319]|uniref:Uncharacterized protein n=1 Tax=Prevotella veroralis F0319 TaxID=649761 RepID=C9MNJ8_9BACT|nr:hypothetical protein HMPREF0973_01185 [Prevotella veroralis F0319]
MIRQISIPLFPYQAPFVRQLRLNWSTIQLRLNLEKEKELIL